MRVKSVQMIQIRARLVLVSGGEIKKNVEDVFVVFCFKMFC